MKNIALRLAAVFLFAIGVMQAQGPDISGNWQGTLQVGKGLRTILKISKADNGGWKAQLYSIDQGGDPFPVTTVSLDKQNFAFTIKPLDLTYAGTMNADHTAIEGSATQGGQAHVLNLTHVTAENTWTIPEPPKSMPPNAQPKFDVVTVKPSDPNKPGKLFTIQGRQILTINTSVNDLMTFAYSLQTKEILNAPSWMGEKYDLDGVPDIPGQPDIKQMRMLIADALVQRFGLKFHTEQREMTAYALTVAKGGPKLTPSALPASSPGGFGFRGQARCRPDRPHRPLRLQPPLAAGPIAVCLVRRAYQSARSK
jgi:hypothetical protein